MKTTRILAFAAVAALSLGVGSAMAESDGPSMPTDKYDVPGQSYQAPAAHQVQSGGSDMTTRPAAAPRSLSPTSYDYGDLANPG